MTMPWNGPGRDLILSFPLTASLAEAELAQAATAFDMRHAASIDQPALVLVISRGISLHANTAPPSGTQALHALGWEPAGTVELYSDQHQRLAASHFGADSQLHMIAVDPDDDTGETLMVLMRRGLDCGHVWFNVLRTADAFQLGTSDIAVDELPSGEGPLTALAEHLIDQLRAVAAAQVSQRIARTLVSPETAAAILAVHDSADHSRRQYLLGLPMALLCDVAWRILGGTGD